MDLFNLQPILEMSNRPSDKDAFNEWIEQKESLNFLLREAVEDHVIIFASLPNLFLHAILVKDFEAESVATSKLDSFHVEVDSTWGVVVTGDEIYIEAPLSDSRIDLIDGAERVLFRRSFDGVAGSESYFELNQKLSHILNIHFVPERAAWCKLDERGNIHEIVKITEIQESDASDGGVIVSIHRDSLCEYAALEDFCLMRKFDFTRFDPSNFIGWHQTPSTQQISNDSSVLARLTVISGYGSYANGWQKIDLANEDKANALDKHRLCSRSETKQYATYIAQDWKNSKVQEISCEPSCLANYFTESNLPFELTPAFFDPEVLLKYKSDRDKYELTESSIGCRGTWHLKTYGINDAGQVHTYLGYLGRLPYNEQLHWKQFNEKPKAPISDQTYKTDFEGSWDREYDPLTSLKEQLSDLGTQKCGWWELRDKNLIVKAQYPFTESRDEWAEELLNLDQLLVEGLVAKSLRKKAKLLGRNSAIKELEKKSGSSLRELKLLEQCLVGSGMQASVAAETMAPLHELHNFRSIFKGHATGNAKMKQAIEKELLKKHKLHRLHFRSLCEDCDKSLRSICAVFSAVQIPS